MLEFRENHFEETSEENRGNENRERRNRRQKKTMVKKIGALTLSAVLFGTVAAGTFQGINYLAGNAGSEAASGTENNQQTSHLLNANVLSTDNSTRATGTLDVSSIAEAAMPSIVSITNRSVQEVQNYFQTFGFSFQQPQTEETESCGSGIIIGQNDTELLIVTNNHVVEGADTLSVSFIDNQVYEANIKGTDAANDLAVIAVPLANISEDTMSEISVAAIGSSDDLKVGEQVVAIGNALGYGQSVTSGWVSALNRDMTDEDGKVSEDLIQTDAAINPGNSGGALLNMKGELIGINVAKSSGNAVEGMGYAIPIAKAEPVLDSLMSRETRFKVDESQAAYIGVTCMNVDSSVTEMYGIPEGAFVDSVEAGGPAEQAGIQANDVITKFDGIQITGSQELVDRLEYYEAGETVDVVYSRAENGEYQEHTVSVTLGRRSEMTQEDPAEARQ